MDKAHPFTIYNASAGSGKTFTLVKEYLLLLFKAHRKDTYKQILAVTFTNKAVAEMKTRIVDTLFAFSKEECPKKYQGLLETLSEETGLSLEEIRLRSNQILKSIIHNYAAFEVSTIDGFTHRVLRSFAKDLGLPLNFEVELNTTSVLQEAVERLLSKVGKEKELTKVLVNFALSKTDDDKSWDIARDLYKIAELLVKETNRPFLNLLQNKSLTDFQNLANHLKKHLLNLEENTQQLALDFFGILEAHSLEHTDFSGAYCPKFFLKLEKRNFPVDFDKAWQENIEVAPLYSKKVNAGKKVILDDLQPQIAKLFLEAKQNILTMEFLKAIQKNLVPLSLLRAIQLEVEAIKKERSLVLISDFNATIASAVKDQPAPFIYERLGERYRNYFIDEFQDTSELQWTNLIPLIGHALSTQDAENKTGSLTIVGDAKQSIYRWRGGKAEQFMELCKGSNPFNLEAKEPVVLPKNYRSTSTIVNFNNDFFKFASASFTNEDHRDLFLKTSYQEPANDGEGYVNISFVEAENAEEEMKVYPEKVFQIIEELKQKKVPMSDVCILTRRKKEGVAIANFLSEKGIPIVSFETLLVSRSPEVQFVVSLLAFSLNGKDKTLKLQLLQYLLEHQVEIASDFEEIASRIQLEGQQFFDSLAAFGFQFKVRQVTEYSLYEAVEYCIRAFGLLKSSDAYVQFFLDFVFEQSQKEAADIAGFLEIWDRKKEDLSIVAPKSEDAVQILTVHKSKGLEFPVVIYPFANSNITDVAREHLWLNLPEPLNENIPVGYIRASGKMENWGEEASGLYNQLCCNSQLDALNVLYVALTRPVQQLYVISKMDLNSKGIENQNRFSGLFISYLKNTGRWNGSNSYSFGNREKYQTESRSPSTALIQENFYSSATEGQGISIVTKSGMLWNSQQEKAIEKGHLMHDLFSKINVKADVEEVLNNAVGTGMFRKEELPKIRMSMLQVIQHPQLSEFYSGIYQNRNETDIISASGVLRPDRLNFKGDQVSIIDYKTGAPSPSHRVQIDEYAQVLSEMGFKIDKKFIVYMNEEIVIV